MKNKYNPVKAVGFEKLDSDVASLWEQNKKWLGITFNRSPEYIDWRFNQSPAVYKK